MQRNVKPSIISRLNERVKHLVSPTRRIHIIGTTLTCLELADHLGDEDKESFAIASLAHDMGRDMALGEIKNLFKKYGDQIPDADIPFPQLWHCNVAALLLKNEFHITDPEILRAVLIHSTGDAAMTTLDKVLFVADFIEPTRSFNSLDLIRSLAYNKFEHAFVRVIQLKFDYLVQNAIEIHPRLMRAHKFYVEGRNEQENIGKEK